MTEQFLTNQDCILNGEKNPFVETITEMLLFREQSECTALICGEESLSYRQLAADAKQIAYCLIGNGLQKGDRILLSVRGSLNFVRAIYGILLAGGVYVAADAKWPDERLRLISEEAGVSMRITDELISEYLMTKRQEMSLPVIKEEDEAAVYYTSGSTGKPKGTVLHHRVMTAYADPARILQEYAGRDRYLTFPVFTSIIPAILVFMFTAYEKTLIVATPQEMASVDRLAECLIRNRVQSLAGTPSFLLRALMHPLFAKVIKKQVTLLALGGELLKESDAAKLYSAMENGVITTGYGSSETYICSMSRYEPGKAIRLERIPRGVELYVLDENLDPVSNGETGELMVGGVSAQYGHYLDPELNRKKYVDHPVYGRCFRIGDAARLDEKGRIVVLGRIDRMIKLHGLRIEPGEVEAVMEQYPGIRRAAVDLKNNQLCGYYMGEGDVEESSLRRFLSERLTYFMIPSKIMYLKTLPISGNGKLDYKALPEPETGEVSGSAPANEREQLLCRIFGEVLNTKKMPGAEDSFFSFGGDSIHALKVASLLEKEGFSMELKDLFAAPTARLLAPLLNIRKEDAQQKTASFDVPEEIRAAIQKEVDWEDVETVYPASAVVETYLKKNNNAWPQVYCFDISGGYEAEQIETAVQEVSRNHTAIRTLLLPAGNGHFCQVVLKTPRTQFFRVDLSTFSEGGTLSRKQKDYLSTLIRMEYSPVTDLGKRTLLRVGHIRISKEKALLYIGSSHLTMEAASVYQIFLELTGQKESRPDSRLMNRHMGRLFHADRSEVNAYWENLLKGCERYTELPKEADAKGTAPKEEKQETVFSSCGRQLYEKAKEFCRTHQVTLSALLGYSFGKSLMELLSVEEVCFPVVGSGRSASEMELPGMFVVFFPLRLRKTDTVYTCQNQLLTSGEHAWVWADPAYSSIEGNPLFLRAAHSSAPAEEGQLRLLLDILEPDQVRKMLGGYYDSDRDTIGIFVEMIRQLAWTMVFDSRTHNAGLIRDLSAEWIRQLKACVGTMEPSF